MVNTVDELFSLPNTYRTHKEARIAFDSFLDRVQEIFGQAEITHRKGGGFNVRYRFGRTYVCLTLSIVISGVSLYDKYTCAVSGATTYSLKCEIHVEVLTMFRKESIYIGKCEFNNAAYEEKNLPWSTDFGLIDAAMNYAKVIDDQL